MTTINDLVRDGRVSSKDGVAVLKLRNELAQRRDESSLRRNPLAKIALGIGFVFLALLGVRRDG